MLSYVVSVLKRDTFQPTKGPLFCSGMNGPECIRVTRQPIINANRMKGVIKRDKCRHEQCRKTKRWRLWQEPQSTLNVASERREGTEPITTLKFKFSDINSHLAIS